MKSFMSNPLCFIVVLSYMSDLLNCLDIPYEPVCRNAAQKVLDRIQSQNETEMFKASGDPVSVNIKKDRSYIPVSITTFCDKNGDLEKLMGGNAGPANTVAFHIDVVQEPGYGSPVLQINNVWMPDFGNDILASINILYCQSQANYLSQLMQTFVGNMHSSAPGSPNKAAKINYILDGSDKIRPIPVLVVLQGTGIRSKNHPTDTYPFIEMRTRPTVVQPDPAQTWFGACHIPENNLPCCLDVVNLDVNTQLNGTKLAKLSIVEPQSLQVHFCRPNPKGSKDPSTPTGSPKCCVPYDFNIINVVTEGDAPGFLSNVKLDNIDVHSCSSRGCSG